MSLHSFLTKHHLKSFNEIICASSKIAPVSRIIKQHIGNTWASSNTEACEKSSNKKKNDVMA